MANDAVQLVAALGGERITYRPFNGTAKQFKAIVEREPTRVSAFSGVAYPEQAMLVTFPKDATDGMTSIGKGKDRIACKRHVSDTQETEYTVVMVQDEDMGMLAGDGGMWTVLVK
jgi:hypothetical protein